MFPSYYINLMAQQLDQKINGVPDFGMIGRNWGSKSNDYQGEVPKGHVYRVGISFQKKVIF